MIDYTRYGIDLEAVDATRMTAFIQASADAISAEATRDAETDPEDREILAERAAQAVAKAEALRLELRLTKNEGRAQRRALLENYQRQLAQQHLTLESQRDAPGGPVKADIDHQQGLLERQLDAVDHLIADVGPV